jgi:hypothetical protein
MRARHFALPALLVLAAGCGSSAVVDSGLTALDVGTHLGVDASVSDAYEADAFAPDAASLDAAAPDAAALDAAAPDATAPDAAAADALASDARSTDAAPSDANSTDAPPLDALAVDGSLTDTGVGDAASLDASLADGSTMDAAGADAQTGDVSTPDSGVCPIDLGPSRCGTCVDANCCAQLVACNNSPQCFNEFTTCFANCQLSMPVSTCANMCFRSPEGLALRDCESAHCSAECG